MDNEKAEAVAAFRRGCEAFDQRCLILEMVEQFVAPLSPDVEAAEKAWGLFWEKHKLPDEAFIAPGYVVADDIAAFADEYARAVRAPRLTGEQKEAWCPDVCPITGLEFFMWIEPRGGGQMVPTYGGPFNSYTIPVKDSDGDYVRERYDHDEGAWTEYENCAVRVVDADELDSLRSAFPELGEVEG